MDSQYVGIMIAEAIGAMFNVAIWFCCGWFLLYVILGSWFQVQLCRLRASDISSDKKRTGPVFVSHLLFSLLFINPYVLVFGAWHLDDLIESIFCRICLIIIYFLVFPMAFDLFILRVVSKWKKLRWFRWQHPLKRVLPVSLLICLIALGAGFLSIELQKITPTLARSLPLRPKAFSWKVDTGMRPLIDWSVLAETDRMFSDGKYMYVRVDSKKPTWVVINCNTHEIVKTDPTVLGYVLADDSGVTWQIKKDSDGSKYSRVDEEELKVSPIGYTQETIFLEHQVDGMIIGAIPSYGYVFAFDPITGQEVWRTQAPAAKGNNDRRIGSLAGTTDIIAVGLWMSRAWAIDPKNGEQLWLFEEKGYGNSMHVEASDSGIVGFSRSDKVYSFSPNNGEVKWSKKFSDLAGGEGNICLINDQVIFRDKTSVSCVDIQCGDILWKKEFGDHYSGGVSCSDKGIVACASDRTLVLFESDSGTQLFQTKFPIRSGREYGVSNNVQNEPGRIYTHPVISDIGAIYVFTGDGTLWTLKPNL